MPRYRAIGLRSILSSRLLSPRMGVHGPTISNHTITQSEWSLLSAAVELDLAGFIIDHVI